MKKLAVLAASLLVALLAAEGVARALHDPSEQELQFLERLRAFAGGEQHPLYAPHPYTLYAKRSEGGSVFYGPPPEPHASRGPDGALRIACLGGSTTEGGPQSYPYQLRELLRERLGTDVEVMNWGVSGWTSAESLVNWFLRVQDYAPDVVVIHHAVNDVRPRMVPGFRSDYAHYRSPWKADELTGLERFLLRHSVLYASRLEDRSRFTLGARVTPTDADGRIPAVLDELAAPADTFRRNLRALCRGVASAGARAVLLTMPYNRDPAWQATDPKIPLKCEGLREHNAVLRELAREEGALLVDCERWFEEHPGQVGGHFKDTVHLSGAGNRLKATQLADALVAAGWTAPGGGR